MYKLRDALTIPIQDLTDFYKSTLVNRWTLQKSEHSITGIHTKPACQVCLKQWDLDYNRMIQSLDIPLLSTHHEHLKLTTALLCIILWLRTAAHLSLLIPLYNRISHTVFTITLRPFACTEYTSFVQVTSLHRTSYLTVLSTLHLFQHLNAPYIAHVSL